MVDQLQELEVHTQKVKISYDFFTTYPTTVQEHIHKMIQRRLQGICEKNFLPPETTRLEDVFTDIFSWSVLPASVVQHICDLLTSHGGVNQIVDLCCGNGFHTFAFAHLTQFPTYTGDIQDEPHSWMPIQVGDARKIVQTLPLSKAALLLSWIDYQELGVFLLSHFDGPVVLSFGNYSDRSPKYLHVLQTNFVLQAAYDLLMPWNRVERIEVYFRK